MSDLATDQALTSSSSAVKGFATIDNVSLINVEGTGMVGVPGIASAIFSTVRDAGVNVIMISQASSEHSVCFAVKENEAELAVSVLSKRWVTWSLAWPGLVPGARSGAGCEWGVAEAGAGTCD